MGNLFLSLSALRRKAFHVHGYEDFELVSLVVLFFCVQSISQVCLMRSCSVCLRNGKVKKKKEKKVTKRRRGRRVRSARLGLVLPPLLLLQQPLPLFWVLPFRSDGMNWDGKRSIRWRRRYVIYSKHSVPPRILLRRVFLGRLRLTRGKEEIEAVYNEKGEGGGGCYGGWGCKEEDLSGTNSLVRMKSLGVCRYKCFVTSCVVVDVK